MRSPYRLAVIVLLPLVAIGTSCSKCSDEVAVTSATPTCVPSYRDAVVTIVVSGSGLTEIKAVSIGGESVGFGPVSDNQLQFELPYLPAGVHQLDMYCGVDRDVCDEAISVYQSVIVDSIEPDRGTICGGTEVEITGEGLAGIVTVGPDDHFFLDNISYFSDTRIVGTTASFWEYRDVASHTQPVTVFWRHEVCGELAGSADFIYEWDNDVSCGSNVLPPVYLNTDLIRGVQYVGIGDFNNPDATGDGDNDIVVAAGYTAVIYGGNGDGSFERSYTVSWPSLSTAMGVAVADFNNDNRDDVAIACDSPSEVILLMQSTGGVLEVSPVSPDIELPPSGITAALIDDDANVDLAVGTPYEDSIYVYVGDGTGGFTGEGSEGSYNIGAYPTPFIASGDLDPGDARADVFLGNRNNVEFAVESEFSGGTMDMASTRLADDVYDATQHSSDAIIFTAHSARYYSMLSDFTAGMPGTVRTYPAPLAAEWIRYGSLTTRGGVGSLALLSRSVSPVNAVLTILEDPPGGTTWIERIVGSYKPTDIAIGKLNRDDFDDAVVGTEDGVPKVYIAQSAGP